MASEQKYYGISTTNTRKAKATWTADFHEIFVDLCHELTLKGCKPGTHLNKEGWRDLEESFHRRAGVRYNRLQLKNHWDVTKEQWRVWCKLIGTDSMRWDPDTLTFGASEEDWANYIQANPGAAQFKSKELPFTDKLGIIYDGTVINGETAPRTPCRRTNDNLTAYPLRMRKPRRAKPVTRVEHPCDVVESRSGVTVQSPTGKINYSIGECIMCLDGMEEVEQGSDLYLFALDIFLKKEYREIFLQLKKPSLRVSWLERLQSVGQSFSLD